MKKYLAAMLLASTLFCIGLELGADFRTDMVLHNYFHVWEWRMSELKKYAEPGIGITPGLSDDGMTLKILVSPDLTPETEATLRKHLFSYWFNYWVKYEQSDWQLH